MPIGIQVAVRCRPFTIDDALGVQMVQNSETEGEINLLHSKYSKNRFAFSWSWWSAYGYGRHLKNPDEDKQTADDMKLISQLPCYEGCGKKIKDDLLGGNAVVLFAYGLSGSGKTFTVFGPDAVDSPDAWFKHAEPHNMWGIFPRLAYELFQEKGDGWKITMKYFQNIVDTVRDLNSPTGEEQSYKTGMRKDQDGFMDVTWTRGIVLSSWDDLRKAFMTANARKAIAPTQFNHQSTRGHCIMTLEVEMPNPDNPGVKQIGRVYVCDLAGTEPAGDIFYADYKRIAFEDGTVEHKLIGPNRDTKKTKELQDQGKMINLSLSEMAQFFMKMADAVKKKKLKPGGTIPGCNSYFLCKYLKDTMLQARTYLFCAIRPEVTYHKYTFATLGFAENASVIKLQPKKSTANMSPAERKLMEELDSLKQLVASLQEANAKMAADGGGGGGGGPEIAALQAALASKQAALASSLGEGGGADGGSAQAAEMERQVEEYGKRGISLAAVALDDTTEPYLINLDEDPFRSKRFMFVLTKPVNEFGPGGDIAPLSMSVKAKHCTVFFDPDVPPTGEPFKIVGGEGETYVNGAFVAKDEEIRVSHFDRIALGTGGFLTYLVDPRLEEEGDKEPPDAGAAFEEYSNGRMAHAMSDRVGAGGNTADAQKLREEMERFQKEKEEFATMKRQGSISGDGSGGGGGGGAASSELLDLELLDLMPKMKEARELAVMLGRPHLLFNVALQRGKEKEGSPNVKVNVHNDHTAESMLIDTYEFSDGLGIIRDEVSAIRTALENNRDYEVAVAHDPVSLMFDKTSEVGSALLFSEFMLYNLETDPEEVRVPIKSTAAPYGTVGSLEVTWDPLGGPDEEDWDKAPLMHDDPSELLGKQWAYRVNIRGALGLPIVCERAYIQYEFDGELFTTETIEYGTEDNPAAPTSSPKFDYSFVHSTQSCSQEFIDALGTSIHFHIYASPSVAVSQTAISTSTPAIRKNFGHSPSATGGAAENGVAGGHDETVEAQARTITELEQKVVGLEALVASLRAELAGGSSGTPRAKLAAAQAADGVLNG